MFIRLTDKTQCPIVIKKDAILWVVQDHNEYTTIRTADNRNFDIMDDVDELFEHLNTPSDSCYSKEFRTYLDSWRSKIESLLVSMKQEGVNQTYYSQIVGHIDDLYQSMHRFLS